jgi:hypothetical protein
MTSYKNRYDDVYTFEKTDDGNIMMKGDFKWLRFGYPNEYSKAYEEYLKDNKNHKYCMDLKTFKEKVHDYDKKAGQLVYEKYARLVESRADIINMLDPSGGPYMCQGMDMGTIGKEFMGMKIKEFKPHPDGYKILIDE